MLFMKSVLPLLVALWACSSDLAFSTSLQAVAQRPVELRPHHQSRRLLRAEDDPFDDGPSTSSAETSPTASGRHQVRDLLDDEHLNTATQSVAEERTRDAARMRSQPHVEHEEHQSGLVSEDEDEDGSSVDRSIAEEVVKVPQRRSEEYDGGDVRSRRPSAKLSHAGRLGSAAALLEQDRGRGDGENQTQIVDAENQADMENKAAKLESEAAKLESELRRNFSDRSRLNSLAKVGEGAIAANNVDAGNQTEMDDHSWEDQASKLRSEKLAAQQEPQQRSDSVAKSRDNQTQNSDMIQSESRAAPGQKPAMPTRLRETLVHHRQEHEPKEDLLRLEQHSTTQSINHVKDNATSVDEDGDHSRRASRRGGSRRDLERRQSAWKWQMKSRMSDLERASASEHTSLYNLVQRLEKAEQRQEKSKRDFEKVFSTLESLVQEDLANENEEADKQDSAIDDGYDEIADEDADEDEVDDEKHQIRKAPPREADGDRIRVSAIQDEEPEEDEDDHEDYGRHHKDYGRHRPGDDDGGEVRMGP